MDLIQENFLKCIFLTNSHAELEQKLIELYGLSSPRSGQFRFAVSSESNIKRKMEEGDSEWAIFESSQKEIIVGHTKIKEEYPVFLACRGKKIESKKKLTEF